jgi:hypothetical protein
VLPAFIAGCDLLMSGFGANGGLGGDGSEPSPQARYTTGKGTVTLGDGSAHVLDRLQGTAALYAEYGASVAWAGSDGWYLEVSAIGGSLGAFGPGYLTLDRVADGHHLTTMDPSRCIVTVDEASAKRVSGKATCKGLTWSDAIGNGFFPGPSPSASGAPFDAEITFEASVGSPAPS